MDNALDLPTPSSTLPSLHYFTGPSKLLSTVSVYHFETQAEERHMAMPHHNIARPGGTHSKPRAISDQAGKATPASPLPQDSSALAPQDRYDPQRAEEEQVCGV